MDVMDRWQSSKTGTVDLNRPDRPTAGRAFVSTRDDQLSNK
jgi:hypothetical protein